MTTINVPAAHARETARENYVRVGREPAAHPVDQPQTNRALAGIVPTQYRTVAMWRLSDAQAATYTDSVGTSSAQRLTQIGATDFTVDTHGQLTGTVDAAGEDGASVTAEHNARTGTSQLYMECDLGDPAARIDTIRLDTDDPSATAIVRVLADLSTDEHDYVHELDDFDTDQQVTDWTPAGFRDFIGRVGSTKCLDDAAAAAREEAQEQNEDPDEPARDAYLRGIGVRR